ncbi:MULTISPECIES: hypothetical protein [Clostridioides]|uniref:hypothetical protein n=1 Tax=Clostridioides sp. ZZV14-6387 TaxID=2811497 RepID=UPI0007BAFB76|nr:hypothetical protein [Clostridioides sp. ZZV14-6387]CZR95537.1 hypothetical protein CDFC105_60325 [Clostridioides difficile]CZR99895.1 hypothetical protein CDFC105_70080 [Clostridioides difficile]
MDKKIEAICIEVGNRICKICKFNDTCKVENRNGHTCNFFEEKSKIEKILEKGNFITAIDFRLKNISMKEIANHCEENNKKIEICGWGNGQIIVFADKERAKTNEQ